MLSGVGRQTESRYPSPSGLGIRSQRGEGSISRDENLHLPNIRDLTHPRSSLNVPSQLWYIARREHAAMGASEAIAVRRASPTDSAFHA
jgi:hypothetical protein